MKTPYVISQKGWKLYSSGNALSTYSCILIAFTLVVAALVVLGSFGYLNPLSVTVCAIIIIAFNVLALIGIFVGRLLRWKGLTLLLGAVQLTDAALMQDFPVGNITKE